MNNLESIERFKKMKTVIFALMAFVCMANAQKVVITGNSNDIERVYWGTSSDSSLRILHHAGFVYYDSAGLGTNYKRIDNTADSCSRPFWIATRLGTYPTKQLELEGRVRAVNAASNAAVYRVETRYVQNLSQGLYYGWRRRGKVTSYTGAAILDSVSMPHTGVSSKTTVGGLFYVTGDQARLCTDNATGTSTSAGDSVKTDTLIVRRQ